MQFSSMSRAPLSPLVKSGRSSQVIIAFTPLSFSARAVEIFLIRACAWGERKKSPTSCPGALWSAPYLARPVTLSMPSGRFTREPITLNFWFVKLGSFAMSVPYRYSLRDLPSGARRIFKLAFFGLLLTAFLFFYLPKFPGCRLYRADNFVVAGTAAQVACQCIANFGFGRVGVALQKHLRGY